MKKKDELDLPHFVTSHDFHGDTEYVAWLQDMGESISRKNCTNLVQNWILSTKVSMVVSGNGRFERWQ